MVAVFRNWILAADLIRFNVMSQIRIDSSELNPARVDGNSQNAFKTTKLILVKPRLVS